MLISTELVSRLLWLVVSRLIALRKHSLLSTFTKCTLHTLVKRHCNKNNEIKVVFSSFNIKNVTHVKDSIPRLLHSNVIHKCICVGCKSVYVGETSRHLSTRVHEHPHSDKNSQIYKHPKSSDKRRMSCGDTCFTGLDTASTYNHRESKGALHIKLEKPLLNKQVKHLDISLSVQCPPSFYFIMVYHSIVECVYECIYICVFYRFLLHSVSN